ncbi:MAG: tetratricopeptide repeat protein, partial [Bacteroidota bacterium]
MIQFSNNISLSLISFIRNFSYRKISLPIIISLFTLNFSLFTSCKTTESTTKVENQPEAKVNDVVGQDPKATELENTFLEAKKQEILGDAQKALSLYEDCIKIQPENDAVNFQMANILYQTQKYTEAL